MKKYLFILLLCGCSTYVPVDYLTPSGYPAKKDSYVQISIDKDSTLSPAQKLSVVEELGRELNNDGWLKYKRDKSPKQTYEIVIKQFEISSEAKIPSTETVDKKTYRMASYRAIGSASFSIKSINEENPTQFNISSNTIVASRVELPDILGAYSRVGVFSTLMGTNSEADVIEKQDKILFIEALIEAKTRIYSAMKEKFTPIKSTVKVKLEDDHDDMDEVKNLIKANDLTGAVIYLDYLNAKEKRSDIVYNLGVVYEALNYFSEACNYYKEAYELNAKSLYTEAKASCELRQQQFSLLPF
jgi:hypothetical protein